MLMVVPNEGKLRWLNWALVSDGSDFSDFHIRLYTNDYTPDNTSTFGDFTEATFTGYAVVDMLRADWNAPAIVANVAVSDVTAAAEFTCTAGAGETCYGWYMTSDGDEVLATARFDNPRLMNAGATLLLDRELDLKTFH